MLDAAVQLRRQPETWKGTVTVACVVDEEYHFRGTLALMEQAELWDFAVVGEPTVFHIVRGCKGCMRFSICAHGKAHHSSRPERGRNAIVAMARAILELNSDPVPPITLFTAAPLRILLRPRTYYLLSSSPKKR
jgi:acetylornithine deacetylase